MLDDRERRGDRDSARLRRVLELLDADPHTLLENPLESDSQWLDALAQCPGVRWFDWRTSPEAAIEELCHWISARAYLDFEELQEGLSVWREENGERVNEVVVKPVPREDADPIVVAFCMALGDGTSALRITALEGSDSSAYAFVSLPTLRSLEELLGNAFGEVFKVVPTGVEAARDESKA